MAAMMSVVWKDNWWRPAGFGGAILSDRYEFKHVLDLSKNNRDKMLETSRLNILALYVEMKIFTEQIYE
jgi:hypothetical protein